MDRFTRSTRMQSEGAARRFVWWYGENRLSWRHMKNFFTSMLGALAALVIFAVGGTVLMLFFLGVIAAMGGDKPVTVERGAWLVFDLSANITDAPPPIDFGALGDHDSTLQLRSVTQALRTAAKDSRIAGVLLTGALNPAGYGSG